MQILIVVLLVGVAAAAVADLALTLAVRRKVKAFAAELDGLQARHASLAQRVDGNVKMYEGVVTRYNALNAEIGELRAFGAANRERSQAALTAIEELIAKARRAARKKVRTKDPRTGRFIWRYPEELV